MKPKPGLRLRSQVDPTEIIIVRAPATDEVLTCGGHPMVGMDEEVAPGLASEGGGAGTQLGKRYTSPKDPGLEILVTKPGSGTLALGGVELELKQAKPLPASD
ncbi:hypothetical protein [Actinomadura sp. SCN-SB]|uniref:hypothetical protein n=1 Tax=Actinomadura sp. SCN-SB TaxID=3373092 RepID=UPI0037504BBA